MAKKKFYAVRNGYRRGIFDNWDECKDAIFGYKGAEYKSFASEDEAKRYMMGYDTNLQRITKIPAPVDNNTAHVYTVGSFNDKTVGVGVHIEGVDNFVRDFYGAVDCHEYVSLRGFGGELVSVMVGVQCALDMGFKHIKVIYVYDGVEYWYTGEWKAKGELQQIYTRTMHALNADIDFIQAKGDGKKRADVMSKRGVKTMMWINRDKIFSGTLTVKDVGAWFGM